MNKWIVGCKHATLFWFQFNGICCCVRPFLLMRRKFTWEWWHKRASPSFPFMDSLEKNTRKVNTAYTLDATHIIISDCHHWVMACQHGRTMFTKHQLPKIPFQKCIHEQHVYLCECSQEIVQSGICKLSSKRRNSHSVFASKMIPI